MGIRYSALDSIGLTINLVLSRPNARDRIKPTGPRMTILSAANGSIVRVGDVSGAARQALEGLLTWLESDQLHQQVLEAA